MLTKEEAIEILIHEIDEDLFVRTEYRERIHEAFKIAIEALKQQPCEDAISRQAAIRWVKTECNPYGKPTLDFESGKKVIEHLERMSPVTPQKMGHWIWDVNKYKCSKCGHHPWRIITEEHDEVFEDLSRENAYKFCPNCGAKMEVNE